MINKALICFDPPTQSTIFICNIIIIMAAVAHTMIIATVVAIFLLKLPWYIIFWLIHIPALYMELFCLLNETLGSGKLSFISALRRNNGPSYRLLAYIPPCVAPLGKNGLYHYYEDKFKNTPLSYQCATFRNSPARVVANTIHENLKPVI